MSRVPNREITGDRKGRHRFAKRRHSRLQSRHVEQRLVAVHVVASGQEEDLFMWQAVLAGLATLISGAITTPFSAGVDALMTIDQRIRREGLDVQLIHAAQQGGPAPWPSAARAR